MATQKKSYFASLKPGDHFLEIGDSSLFYLTVLEGPNDKGEYCARQEGEPPELDVPWRRLDPECVMPLTRIEWQNLKAAGFPQGLSVLKKAVQTLGHSGQPESTPLKSEEVQLYQDWQYKELLRTLENLRPCLDGACRGLQERHFQAGKLTVLLADALREVEERIRIVATLPAVLVREGFHHVRDLQSEEELRQAFNIITSDAGAAEGE